MKLEQCKQNIKKIQNKYASSKDKIFEYHKELYNELLEFGEESGNYAFEDIFADIVCGEDCEGIVSFPDYSKLYYFERYDSVISIDYNIMTELSNKSLDLLETSKEKDNIDLCY